jgi:aryl-alcohol dehydrogenase-like predicted oxidoreductase
METVAMLIRQGKVRYAGVCNYNVAQMKEAEKYVPLVSNQVPYSMVKPDIEKEVVPHCIAGNKSILAYSPLERGLLTGKMKPGYKFQEGDHRAGLYFFTDENIRRTNEFLKRINPLADQKKITLAQLVLCWTINRPGITIALAGARNAEQAVANTKAADVKLTATEMQMINNHLKSLELVK